MKQFFQILSILMLLLLMTAEDCSNNSTQMARQKIQREQFQQIEEDFVNDEISKEMLLAFEERAVQKLKDLDDFVTIYMSEGLPKEFREQAKNMIHKEFYSEDDCHRFFAGLSLKEDTAQVLLFRSGIQNKLVLKTDSVSISERIQKHTGLRYLGEIGFTVGLLEVNRTDTIFTDSKNKVLKIIIVKTEKEFGPDIEKVWEILFANREL
jgi:hypothetical protein